MYVRSQGCAWAIASLLLILTPFSLSSPYTLLPAVAQTTQERKAEGDRLFSLGTQQYQTSQFEAAVNSWQQALQIYREIKNRSGEGTALGKLGLAYEALGNYGKAIEYQNQSFDIAQKIGDQRGKAESLINLGVAYRSRGDVAKALEYHQSSLRITREIGDRDVEGSALGNLGMDYYALGNYTQAIKYHEQRLAIAHEIDDRQGEGNAMGNLGNAYRAQGNYAKAIEFHEQRLAIARAMTDQRGEGQSLGFLGLVYRSLGNYPKAINYYKQSLEIAVQINDRSSKAKALGYLGRAYYDMGDYQEAIKYHQASLEAARQIKDRRGEGKSLGYLGDAYFAQGKYPEAIQYYQSSLEIAIAQKVKDRRGQGKTLTSLGNVYLATGNYAKAIEYEEQSLAIAREIKNREGEGNALHNLGVAFFKAGNLAAAANTLREGIVTWELLRQKGVGNNDANKVSIFEQQARTYGTLQQVLVAQNQPNAALEIAERGRARAFVDLLAQRVGQESGVRSQELGLKPLNLQQIQQITKAQNATLVQYSIIYDDVKTKDGIRDREPELYIWVIKPTGEVTFRTSDLKPLWQKQHTSLAELVTTSRDSIGVRGRGLNIVATRPPADQTNHLKQLHQLLIQPIADLLPSDPNARVIFLPQSSLFLVPFAALQDPSGKYLIEKHTILTAPSIQVLQLTHQQRAQVPGQAKDVLVAGNPTMPTVQPPGQDKQQLPQLPGAEQEAKDIAQLLHTQALIGNQANKATIVQELPKAKMIHLATHGLLDDFKGAGVPGAIALGPTKVGEPNDGLLTADEILEMKLSAELAVLSACDTGQGKITGDGVVGLSRSLITAGVPSIIVSLWSVPDAPTASLMKQFYTNLQHNPDKAQALRQAMLTTMKEHPEPRNWAAFTLIGESQ